MTDDNKIILFSVIVILGLVAIGGGATMTYRHYKQRGIRNDNPGNLRPSKDQWQGQSGIDNGINGPYLIFKGPEWGIRALYKNLMTYRNVHKLTTIDGILHRWAPAADKNDVKAYIASVSKAVNKAATAPLALSDYPALVKAIIKHENGVQPYPDTLINQGIALAA